MFEKKTKNHHRYEEDNLPITREQPIGVCDIPEKLQSPTLDRFSQSVGDASMLRISPIIFTSIGNNKNYGLIDLPLQISQAVNFKVLDDEKRLELLTNRQLNTLKFESRDIASIEATNYIIQNSFMSFCSLIDQCDLNQNTKVLTYLPIKQMVYESLEKAYYSINNNIESLIKTFALSHESNFKDADDVQNATLDNVINYSLSIRDIILQYIVDAICIGTDKAVNDILMQVHTVPNINEIYLEISRYITNLGEFKKSCPESYSTICAIAIKSYLRDQINILISRNLMPTIEYLVSKLFYIQANVYDDHYYSIKEIKNTMDSKNQNHSRCSYDNYDDDPDIIVPI